MAKKQVKKGKPAKKGKQPANKGAIEPVSAMLGHPDRRLPVWNDDTHEILCKWIDAQNEYHCEKVPTGGDWPDA
jgi:hypothetical protein